MSDDTIEIAMDLLRTVGKNDAKLIIMYLRDIAKTNNESFEEVYLPRIRKIIEERTTLSLL